MPILHASMLTKQFLYQVFYRLCFQGLTHIQYRSWRYSLPANVAQLYTTNDLLPGRHHKDVAVAWVCMGKNDMRI